MTSNSQQTARRRYQRRRNQGQRRKKAEQNRKNTPEFPIHPEGGKQSTQKQ